VYLVDVGVALKCKKIKSIDLSYGLQIINLCGCLGLCQWCVSSRDFQKEIVVYKNVMRLTIDFTGFQNSKETE
jgi:hypothetical protein